MPQSLRFDVQGQGERTVAIRRAFNIGFTIRDAAKMQAHLDEVAKEGVPMPRVGVPPIVFPLSPWAVTQDEEVPVQYARTSGEVEIVTIVDGDDVLVSVGSDHTDRELETIDIPWSKQACPSIVARSAWRWQDVADTWDQVEIGSEIGLDPARLHPYQRANVREFMSPPEMTAGLRAKLRSQPAGPFAFWSGTVVSLESELEYPPVWRIWLHNPALGWRIEHTYRSPVLFGEVDTSDMTFARRGTLPA
jgi:hypothetical protein